MTAATMSEDDERKRREQVLLDTLGKLSGATKKMGEQLKDSATVAGTLIDKSFFKRWRQDRDADDEIAEEAYAQRARLLSEQRASNESLGRQEKTNRRLLDEFAKLRQGLFDRMDDEFEYRKLMDRRNGIRKQVSSWERQANAGRNQPTTGDNQSGSFDFGMPGGKPGGTGGWFGGGNKNTYRKTPQGRGGVIAERTRTKMSGRPTLKPEVNGGFITKTKQIGKKIAESRAGRAVTRLGERVAGSVAGQAVKSTVAGGVKKVAESAAGQAVKKGAALAAEKLAGQSAKTAIKGAVRTGAEFLGKIPIVGIAVTGGLTAYDQSQKTEADIQAEGGKTVSVLKSLAGNASFGLSDYLMDKAKDNQTVQGLRESDLGRLVEGIVGRTVAVAISPFSKEARDAIKADWKANVTPIVDKALKSIDDTTKSWRDGMSNYMSLAKEQLVVWKDIAGNGIKKMIDTLTNLPTILAGMALGGIQKAADMLPSNWDVSKFVPTGVKNAANSVSIKAGYLENRDALVQGAKRTGADVGFLTRMAVAESGFDEKIDASKNGTRKSTAGGLYQFTDGTWNDMLKRYGKELGLSPNASKYDPKAASLLAGKLAGDNKRALDANLGRSANAYDQYMAWFLGAGKKAVISKGESAGRRSGAIGFLDAMAKNPNAVAADVMSLDAIKSNESVFYEMGKDANGNKVRKRARTLAEVYKLMGTKMEGGAQLAQEATVYAANNYGYNGPDRGSGMIKGAPVAAPAAAPSTKAPQPGAQAQLRKADAKAAPEAKVKKPEQKKSVQGDKAKKAALKAEEEKKKQDAAMAASASALALSMSAAANKEEPAAQPVQTPAGAVQTAQVVEAVKEAQETLAAPAPVAPAAEAMPVMPTAVGAVPSPLPDEQEIDTQIVKRQIVQNSNDKEKEQPTQAPAAVAAPQAVQAEPAPAATAVAAQAPAEAPATQAEQAQASAVAEPEASVAAPEPVAAVAPVAAPEVVATAQPERPVSDTLPPEVKTVVVDNQPDFSKMPAPQVIVKKDDASGSVGPMPTLNDIPTTIAEMGLGLVNMAQT